MRNKILIIVISHFGLASCIYPYDGKLTGTNEDIVVIDGNIVAGGTSTVNLSKVLSFAEGARYDSEAAKGKAWIEDDAGGKYYPSSPEEISSSLTINTENAPEGRKYRLVANVEGKIYSSDWLDVVKAPIIEDIEIGLSKDRTDVDVKVTVRGGEGASGFIGLSYDETWEFHADYECRYELDTLRWRVFPRMSPYPNYWCWKHESSQGTILMDYSELDDDRVTSYKLLSFPTTSKRNHKRYSINVKAVNLPEVTFKYMKNLESISKGQGSLFSPNPGEMVSNVRCESDPSVRVLGYVTALLEASKRVFIGSKFYTYVEPPITYLFVPADIPESYGYGNYPVDLMTLPKGEMGADLTTVFWGPLRCMDCVVEGGTKQRPDFWR